jgi:hypothetical protein
MSLIITPISQANPFDTLFTAANTLIQVMANQVVTANNAAGGGATTTGNGFVIGIFGANTIVATTLQGGNVTSTNTVYLGSNLSMNGYTFTSGIITANATVINIGNSSVYSVFSNASVELVSGTAELLLTPTSMAVGNTSSNATINSAGIFFDGVNYSVTLPTVYANTSGAGTFVIDSFLLSLYRASEYVLSVTDNNANNFQLSKLLLLQMAGAADSTEYGIIVSNSVLGSFSSSVNATSAILSFTPTSSNTTVKGTKNLIVV